MQEQAKHRRWRQMALHYVHGIFWIAVIVLTAALAARSYWDLALSPLAEIMLLAICLAIPVPLAIRAVDREEGEHSDEYAVEHLLGAIIARTLALLFDLAVAVAIVGAYFGFVFLLWAIIKALIGQF